MNSVIAALVAGAVVCGLTTTVRAEDTLKIGVINPYTGPQAIYGEELTRGYTIAVNEVNAKGGVLGKKIELIRADAATPQQAIAAVEQLDSRDHVAAFMGTYASAVSNTASDAAAQTGKLYWETNALAANLTERGLPTYIRSGTDAGEYARITVAAVKEMIAPALHKKPEDLTVWLEHEDSIYGTTIADIQKKLFATAGVKVLGVGAHAGNAIDLNDVVLRAHKAAPDVWIETGYVSDGNLMLRTARDQGFKPPVLLWVGTGDTFETLESMGAPALEGMLVVTYTRPDVPESFGPGAHAYEAAYEAAWHKPPIAPHGMAAYVGAQIMLAAIAAAGSTDADKVRAAALKMDKPLHSYATGYGVKFDASMQNTRAAPGVIQWQSGKVVTVYPQAAEDPGTTLKNLARE